MRQSRHKRFYSKREDKKSIPKLQIKTGMIIEFIYRKKDNSTTRPLVFVMDTDEYVARNKKTFHGIDLNYLPSQEVEKFFTNLLRLNY